MTKTFHDARISHPIRPLRGRSKKSNTGGWGVFIFVTMRYEKYGGWGGSKCGALRNTNE